MRLSIFLLLILTLTACNLDNPFPTATPLTNATASPIPQTVTPQATNTALPGMPFGNADGVFTGLCFGFLKTLVGKSVMLDNTSDLSALYEQVKKFKTCPEPATQPVFNFSNNQIVGTVIKAQGCTLDLTYVGTTTDAPAQKRVIHLAVNVAGDCSYELLRPVWLIVPRSAYTPEINVTMA